MAKKKRVVLTNKQKENCKSLVEFHKSCGEKVGFYSTLEIKDGDDIEFFEDVHIELILGFSPHCGVKMRVSEDDINRFDDQELDAHYIADDSTIEYVEYRDYQYSLKELKIEPDNSNKIMFIRAPK